MNIEEFPSDASDAIFRALLEAAPDAMVVADGVGEIILVNAQTEKLFGCTRSELIGGRMEASSLLR